MENATVNTLAYNSDYFFYGRFLELELLDYQQNYFFLVSSCQTDFGKVVTSSILNIN